MARVPDMVRYNRLLEEREFLLHNMASVENAYVSLTERYMEGMIDVPIGKEQRRLKKLHTQYKARLAKVERSLRSFGVA